MSEEQTGYERFRGKCKEFAEAEVAKNPELRLVRGHYYCPVWGQQAHWWCEKADGTIVDPTKSQFPSAGMGEYIEFDGLVECSECGKKIREEEASFESNYCFCSNYCHGVFVGVYP